MKQTSDSGWLRNASQGRRNLLERNKGAVLLLHVVGRYLEVGIAF